MITRNYLVRIQSDFLHKTSHILLLSQPNYSAREPAIVIKPSVLSRLLYHSFSARCILSRRQDTLRVQRILNRLIQFHLRIIIETVRRSNLIHERQMRPILSPALLRRIFYQCPDQPMWVALAVCVFTVEYYADDMVHLAHADYEGAQEVKPGFVATVFCDGILEVSVWAGDFCDGREEEMCLKESAIAR